MTHTSSPSSSLTRHVVQSIALATGFSLKVQKDGRTDLNPYVYTFAANLVKQVLADTISDEAEREAIVSRYLMAFDNEEPVNAMPDMHPNEKIADFARRMQAERNAAQKSLVNALQILNTPFKSHSERRFGPADHDNKIDLMPQRTASTTKPAETEQVKITVDAPEQKTTDTFDLKVTPSVFSLPCAVFSIHKTADAAKTDATGSCSGIKDDEGGREHRAADEPDLISKLTDFFHSLDTKHQVTQTADDVIAMIRNGVRQIKTQAASQQAQNVTDEFIRDIRGVFRQSAPSTVQVNPLTKRIRQAQSMLLVGKVLTDLAMSISNEVPFRKTLAQHNMPDPAMMTRFSYQDTGWLPSPEQIMTCTPYTGKHWAEMLEAAINADTDLEAQTITLLYIQTALKQMAGMTFNGGVSWHICILPYFAELFQSRDLLFSKNKPGYGYYLLNSLFSKRE